MEIQGTSDMAFALQVKSAQMSNNQQEQEGRAALELLQSAAIGPAPSGSSGFNVNTYA